MMSRPAASAGTFTIGREAAPKLDVVRLGFGAMQLVGKGVWGPPEDREAALRVLRRAVELGVTFIDTADAYGPYVAEDLIAEALHPYPDDLVVATKGGLVRYAPGKWGVCGKPVYLRQCVEMSLRRLKLDAIPLYQLHRIDRDYPLADQLGVLRQMQEEGKILHVGLSEVGVDDIEAASGVVEVATVQNRYSVGHRKHEEVVTYCEKHGIGFIPWYPLDSGRLAEEGGPVDAAARRTGASRAQVALAWLLRRSPVILPIPGTSKVKHLEENVAASEVSIPDDLYEEMTAETVPS
jgi:pyridoxine 4-dehydrogenase